jgi:hypothetical protein
VKNRYCIDMISILAILTNIIRYRYGIDALGIEAEPVNIYVVNNEACFREIIAILRLAIMYLNNPSYDFVDFEFSKHLFLLQLYFSS